MTLQSEVLCDYSTDVELPVYELDSGLDVTLMVNSEHDSGLVETDFVIA